MGQKELFYLNEKYVLDLLIETRMLGCRPVASPIDPKIKLTELAGEKVDRERYERLVGHTRPDISFAISVVSRYMHDLRKDHMDAVYQIIPGKGLILRKHGHLNIEGYSDSDWLVMLMIGNPHQDTACLLGATWSLGKVRNSQ